MAHPYRLKICHLAANRNIAQLAFISRIAKDEESEFSFLRNNGRLPSVSESICFQMIEVLKCHTKMNERVQDIKQKLQCWGHGFKDMFTVGEGYELDIYRD